MTVRWLARSFSLVLVALLIIYLAWQNWAPFGKRVEFSLTNQNSQQRIELGPADRVHKESPGSGIIYRQVHDLVYFSTTLPFQPDRATITMEYQVSDPDLALSVGFRDRAYWHYATQNVDSPVLRALNWPKVGNGPYLYQKVPNFPSFESFTQALRNTTGKVSRVGSYQLSDQELADRQLTTVSNTVLADYQPSSGTTQITTPLRGKHVFYTYLKSEPFSLTVTKRDLNWYTDADPLSIQIYKDNALLSEKQIEDDGGTTGSHQLGAPQTLRMLNPWSGSQPDAGVYKVVLDGSDDVVITNIETNLHKIVFESPIFLASNAEVYAGVVPNTEANSVFARPSLLMFRTFHKASLQSIGLPDRSVELTDTKMATSVDMPGGSATITVPRSDVILTSFPPMVAFKESQYFEPSSFALRPIMAARELDAVDYLLTSVQPPVVKDGWSTFEQQVDLRNAVLQSGKLSWIVQAPHLLGSQANIMIRQVNVIVEKEGRW